MITIPKDYVLGKEVLDLAGMHRTNMYAWNLPHLVYGGSKFYHRDTLRNIDKLSPYVDRATSYEFYQCSSYLASMFSTSRATIHNLARVLNWEKRISQSKTFFRIDDKTLEFFDRHNHHVVMWLYNSTHERSDFTEVLTIDVGHNKPVRFGAWL